MRAAAQKSEASSFDLGTPVSETLQIVLAAGLRSLHGVMLHGASPSAEGIHRFRVGLRRLRSILSAFQDALPDPERRKLNRQLAAVARRYARAREWDVLLADAIAPLRAALPEEAALARVPARIAELRRRALPPDSDMRADIDRVAAAFEEASSWLHHPAPGRLGVWNGPLREFGLPLLEKRHRRLRRALKRTDLAHRSALHKLRIRVKKARYPAEIFGILFDSEAATRYRDRLVALQDRLGHLNDALVARDLIAELVLPEKAEGLVTGWLAREAEACRDGFPACVRAFRRADPFWRE